MKRLGSARIGPFEDIAWDAAIAELVSHLDAETAGLIRRFLRILTWGRTGQRQAVVEQFLSKFGAPAPIAYELFSDDVLRRANALSFGHEQLPTFDLARSRFVIAFGADFLGTWNSPVAQGAAYGAMRQGRPGLRGMFVQVESRMSQTGANADEWVPVTPGTEGVLALGLAHVILKEKLRPSDAAGRAGSLILGWSDGLPDFAPDKVEKITGVAAKRIERLARAFAAMRPAVAMVGGRRSRIRTGCLPRSPSTRSTRSGRVRTRRVLFTPQRTASPQAPGSGPSNRSRRPSLARLARRPWTSCCSMGQSGLHGADGVEGARGAREGAVHRELRQLPRRHEQPGRPDPAGSFVSRVVGGFGARVGIARRGGERGRPGDASAARTRATGDVLLDVAAKLHKPLGLPATYDAMLKASFATLPPGRFRPRSGDAWTTAQKQGGWWGALPKGSGHAAAVDDVKKPSRTFTFVNPQFDGDAQQYPFHFLPYPSSLFLDGSLAHLPWLQELPDPLTSAMWSSWVEMNPKTAEKLGIAAGDVVEITSAHGAVKAGAVISPGLAPDIIAMPVGQGISRSRGSRAGAARIRWRFSRR